MATSKRMGSDEDMLNPREGPSAMQSFPPEPQMQQPYAGAAMSMPPSYHPPPPTQGGGVPMNTFSQHHTTVVVNQPAPTVMGLRDWSSSVCSCCEDAGSCLMGTFLPCILACNVAQEMGESCCVPCCVPGWLIVLRTKMRMQQNIQGTVMDDCCMAMCCGNCVLCQLARELKYVQRTAGVTSPTVTNAY